MVPTFIYYFPMRLDIVHQVDRPIVYCRAQKGKGKMKRTSPKWGELEEEATQVPLQPREENAQRSKNMEATQAQDNPKVFPTKQGQGGDKIEVQEVPS